MPEQQAPFMGKRPKCILALSSLPDNDKRREEQRREEEVGAEKEGTGRA